MGGALCILVTKVGACVGTKAAWFMPIAGLGGLGLDGGVAGGGTELGPCWRSGRAAAIT